jgi:tetratricopeptide (TPR) repeat protein
LQILPKQNKTTSTNNGTLPLVIVNPKSAGGSTKDSWAGIASDLRAHFGAYNVAFTKAAGDGTSLAKRACESGRSFIIACGGDGTINEVANGILQSGVDVELGVMPSGTGGDFRRTLDIPQSPREAARALRDGKTKHIKQALELNPNSVGGHSEYANFLSAMGRQAEALVEIKRAIELDPPNLGYKAMQGLILIRARQYDEGLAILQIVREQDPGNWYGGGYLFAISGYTKKGMYAEAVAIAREARELSGVNPITMSFVGQTLAKAGKRAEARVVLEEMLKLSKVRHVSPHNIAMVYNALEMRDETFAQLELSYELREPRAVQLKVETKWDNLHDDPRFQDLLRRVGLK